MIKSPGTKVLQDLATTYMTKVIGLATEESPEAKELIADQAPEVLAEKINTPLTAQQAKGHLGERVHALASRISDLYVRTKQGESLHDVNGEQLPDVVATDDKYMKHNDKIASMHEKEIKNLEKEVDKFAGAVAVCLRNLHKANMLKLKEDVINEVRKMKFKAGVNPNLSAHDKSDTELNDFLVRVSKMIGAGAKKPEVRKAIEEILPMMKKRGVKLTPQQKQALSALKIKFK
jgi:hypothetical protein